MSFRPADLLARYGGEEFAFVLPATPRAAAARMARRCLDAVRSIAIPHDASPTSAIVSLSIGVACYDQDSACWVEHSEASRFSDGITARCGAGDLVAAADKALYAAKQAGRTRAMLLDVADLDTPQMAREVALGARVSAALQP